jgi:hypothetical protein
MALSPACKAQSEVAPDHFSDGPNLEPFEKVNVSAAPKAGKPNPNRNAQVASAQNATAKPGQSMQLTAARDASTPTPTKAVAADKKRQAAARPSKQK